MRSTSHMRLVLLGIIIAQVAHAEPEKPVIKDTYAFDWHRPRASKCKKVTGALLAQLEKRYTCRRPDSESASGRPIEAVCTKGKSEYLVLKTKADCDEERATQLANGP